MSPRNKQTLTIEQSLLGFLRQRPMHGYEIYQQLAASDGLSRVWRLKQSRLYALLGSLEKEGYITATFELQETRPPRKVFHLTPTGQAAFETWVNSPVQHGRQLRLEFLAKLYFARREGSEVAERLIARQCAACRAWLAEQQRMTETLNPERIFDMLVHRFRIMQIEAMLAWLEACQQTLHNTTLEC